MADDAGQVDRRLDAGVAAADHRDALALEKRAIAMRAEADALGLVFLFAGHVHLAPAGTSGEDDRLALQRGAVLQLHFDQLAGNQLGGALQVHHVDVVVLDVLFQRGDQFRSLGVVDGNEVLDAQRVHDLASETLGDDAGTDALAGGVDGGRGAGRATADDEHIEGGLLADGFGGTGGGAGVDLGEDFLDQHPAGAEFGAVQPGGRHGHDLAGVDLVLEHGAVDHRAGDVGV